MILQFCKLLGYQLFGESLPNKNLLILACVLVGTLQPQHSLHSSSFKNVETTLFLHQLCCLGVTIQQVDITGHWNASCNATTTSPLSGVLIRAEGGYHDGATSSTSPVTCVHCVSVLLLQISGYRYVKTQNTCNGHCLYSTHHKPFQQRNNSSKMLIEKLPTGKTPPAVPLICVQFFTPQFFTLFYCLFFLLYFFYISYSFYHPKKVTS